MEHFIQRQLICSLGRRMWEKGWVAANDGNLSLRLDNGRFLITPAGVSKGFLTPEMLLLVDDSGVPLGQSAWHPSSETPLHLACYRARPNIGGVCHAHPAAATAFACARIAIDRPILGETVMTLGSVPVADYGRTGTAELPAAVAPLLPDHDAILLANHGALTLGSDLEAAYWRMETVEHTAQIHLNACLLGGGVELTPEQVAALKGGKAAQ